VWTPRQSRGRPRAGLALSSHRCRRLDAGPGGESGLGLENALEGTSNGSPVRLAWAPALRTRTSVAISEMLWFSYLLVYALDRREPEKRERAREVLRRISTDSITISGAPIFRSFSSAQRPLLWAMDFSSSTISAATLR
jgi:hypothetical protein